MQKKFECLSCHNQFEADDQTMVKCPKCGSDNVEFAHFHLPKSWWKWSLAVVILISVTIVLSNIDWSNDTPMQQENIVVVEPDTTEIFVEDADYIDPEPLPINITPSILAGKPTYGDDGYSLAIRVKDAPGGKYYVSLLEHNGTKEVARSNDGEHFTGIPTSTNDGLFDVAVFLAANDSMICSPLPVGGFESQEVVKDVMTKEQLQKLIEDVNSDLTGAQDWIVTNYKLHFTGLSADDTPPVKLSEVQTRLDLLWDKVTVAKLEYDKNHRITDVYIDVQK